MCIIIIIINIIVIFNIINISIIILNLNNSDFIPPFFLILNRASLPGKVFFLLLLLMLALTIVKPSLKVDVLKIVLKVG